MNKLMKIVSYILFTINSFIVVYVANLFGNTIDNFTNGFYEDFKLNIIKISLGVLFSLFLPAIAYKLAFKYSNNLMNEIKSNKFLSEFNNNKDGYDIIDYSQNLDMYYSGQIMNKFNFVNIISIFIFTVISMIRIDFRLFIIAFVSSILPLIFPIVTQNKLQEKSKNFIKSSEDYVNFVNDKLNGKKEIIRYGGVPWSARLHNEISKIQEDDRQNLKILNVFNNVFSEGINSISQIIVLFTGGLLALNSIISVGEVITSIQLMNYLAAPVIGLVSIYSDYKSSLISKKRLVENTITTNLDEFKLDNKLVNIDLKNEEIAVKLENVYFSYSNKKIFEDLNLDLLEGKSYLIKGKSGSGKSSLINSINGLAVRYDNARTKGEIIIDGKNIKNLELYQISMLVSTVFQNPKTYFFNVNTTLELLFYLENIGLAREEMDKRLKNMLEIFPIKILLNRNIFNLSGGEKQILCIAASYITGTKIIVMDEPSSNLDIKSISVLTNMLKILKEKGISIIIAEHRIYYLMDIVDHVFLIDKGKLKKVYTRSEFLKFDKNELNALSLRDKKLSKLEVPYLKDGGEYHIKNLSYKLIDDECLSLKDISFKLGKIYGIIGSNGRGKSTLLRCLIGLEKKSKEEIYFKGKKLSKKERLKNSSLVMQDVNHQLFTDEVFKELSLGVKNFDEEKAKIILKDLGLDKFIERHPMSLSGGQKQRLAIASIMCKDSTFVYYDEPTSGMDYANMIKISELIKKYRNKDKIIFIVSHDIEFLNEVADEIFKL